jgi:DNA ligase 1
VRRFAALYEALDRTTSTNAKVAALSDYFRAAPPGDSAWALYFLTGRRLKRLLPTAVLHELVLDITALPEWIVGESYSAVGDFAEVLALLTDGQGDTAGEGRPLEDWMRERVLPLREMERGAQKAAVREYWSELGALERLVLNKIVTGEFRVGVSATLVIRALANVAGVTAPVMAHRVMGDWEPDAAFFTSLLAAEGARDDSSRPYPFYLASPLEGGAEVLGDRREWLAEWKWDGIRAQVIRRDDVHIWSRGEELITERFPELRDAAQALPPGTVLDGEILAYRDGVLPFSVLQTRIGRQKLTPRYLADAPAALMTYDLLEQDGRDVRTLPLRERRQRLAALLENAPAPLRLSPSVDGDDWSALAREREDSRTRQVEGLMLKRWDSPYRSGRPRGEWWKWKIAPFTVDTVLIYAHPGHGRRASLFTDYTFAVWNEGALVPIARAYSGLSDAEILELDGWIRRHIHDRFGPVRAVEPVQVFELAFENIARSTRHRSGIAVRFPRILRWRKDKKPDEADNLRSLTALLESRAG